MPKIEPTESSAAAIVGQEMEKLRINKVVGFCQPSSSLLGTSKNQNQATSALSKQISIRENNRKNN